MSPQTSSLSKLLDIEEILKRYPHLSDDRKYNLLVAVQEINEVRNMIKKSGTHDYINLKHTNMPIKDFSETNNMINSMRNLNFLLSIFIPFKRHELKAALSKWYAAGN